MVIIPEADMRMRIAELDKWLTANAPGTPGYADCAMDIQLWSAALASHYPNSDPLKPSALQEPEVQPYGKYVMGKGTVYGKDAHQNGHTTYVGPNKIGHWEGTAFDAEPKERQAPTIRYAKDMMTRVPKDEQTTHVPMTGTVTPIGNAPIPIMEETETEKALRLAESEVARLKALTSQQAPATAPTSNKRPYIVPIDAKIGLVIATHGSAPYVHLNLEAAKRFNSDIRILIHDDSSDDQDKLVALSQQYEQCDAVMTTPYRMAPTVGDISSFASILRWCDSKGIEIAVKCSRRFILGKPWTTGLRELMHNSMYATACSPDAHFSFGFRSELVAMAVKPWIESGAINELEEYVRNNRQHGLPEALYHELSRKVHQWNHPVTEATKDDHNEACDYVVRFEERYGRKNDGGSNSWDAYVPWFQVCGMSRVQQVPGILWHDSAAINDYEMFAKEYGLGYPASSFATTPGE